MGGASLAAGVSSIVEGELLYGYSSVAIVVVLLALILASNEAGYRFASRQSEKKDEGEKTQTNAIQAAMLGLLALLLGFTFTMALQRFDSRSQAVIDEANAIGTAYLRIDLLPDQPQRAARGYSASMSNSGFERAKSI